MDKVQKQITMLLSEAEIPPEAKTHNVTVMKDSGLDCPDLFMSIYVETPSRFEAAQFAEMFVRSRCIKADGPDNADLVVFTGGVDVDPALYGAKRHPKTDTGQESRDTSDINLYLYCLERGIPMFGVCRGAQFLHVMNGGRLYQDVDGHNGEHPIWDMKAKTFVQRASSVHHQMCIENIKGGMEVLAASSKATRRVIEPGAKTVDGSVMDVEAFWYRDTVCLGVQGHPEYRNYDHFTQWCLRLIEENIMYNPDLDGRGGKYRVRPDVLTGRGLGRQESASLAKPEVEAVAENPGPQQEA